jgi:hypothetical protein
MKGYNQAFFYFCKATMSFLRVEVVQRGAHRCRLSVRARNACGLSTNFRFRALVQVSVVPKQLSSSRTGNYVAGVYAAGSAPERGNTSVRHKRRSATNILYTVVAGRNCTAVRRGIRPDGRERFSHISESIRGRDRAADFFMKEAEAGSRSWREFHLCLYPAAPGRETAGRWRRRSFDCAFPQNSSNPPHTGGFQ